MQTTSATDSDHEFGGLSTDLKLSVVGGYLSAFTTALQGKFELFYIDAFAGTGERTVKHAAQSPDLVTGFRSGWIERIKGSARIAIETNPSFDKLIFIDIRKRHCDALRELARAHPASNVEIIRDVATKALHDLIRKTDWKSKRAVLFLDPYGMQVHWETLKLVSQTKAIDVWHLVSLAGLFRQAAIVDQGLSDHKRSAINRMLGTNDWEDRWYQAYREPDLFGFTSDLRRRTVGVDEIESFVKERLSTIFPKVLSPLRLKNKQNVPTFSLFFAISNPNPGAIGLAQKIAGHMLNRGISFQRRPL